MFKKAIAVAVMSAASLTLSGQAAAWCVNVPEANLRQGPGTEHEKSWEVFKYMPLKKVGQKGGWYHMQDVDGDRHWVHGDLVTNRMKCAVVKAETANVRTGPGTHHDKSPLSPVERYYSFKVIETRGNWVKVEDEVFNEGWIYKPLLWLQ
jgi:SH3-like domain-containing protein